ncbi:MAG: tol-pal system protein YbgF [Gammaproteobacteria bacterium]|nr:tol-pal system protein YbgF [Gammaproteobacteria bacterium]
MSKTASIALAGALSLISADALALFGSQDLERRVAQLEQQLGASSQSDLVIQLEQLRTEVQQLRGELEIQQHALDALRRRQQDIYTDVEQRLGGGAPAAPADPALNLMPRPESANSGAIDAGASSTWGQPQSEPSAPVAQAKTADPHQEAAYKAAFEQLKAGQYKTSIESFRSFLGAYPAGLYADNAQYWLAEAYYVQRQYDQALAEFDRVLKGFPQSPKVADALLKMAYIQSDKANTQVAQDLLNRLISQFPNSTAAGLGKKQLERLRAQGN